MLKHKNPKNRGKIQLSKYFQEFKEGDFVAVTPELSEIFGYSHRIHGKTGRVLAKRGEAYYVEVKELDKPKRFLLKPIHLKRIEVMK
ncbi:MAG: 50S ribosomal protein L21e [Nanoarchaeota archaeon]